MPYDISVRGMVDFARYTHILEQQKISRDPLSGILDGNNKVFNTQYSPVLTSGSVGFYVNGSLVPGTMDYNTGELTLTTAPSAQPFATYTFTPYTSFQTLQFLLRGFDEMETLWPRSWRVVDASGNYADETSANLYVVDSAGNDPTVGSLLFSASRNQIALLMAASEYGFLKTRYYSAAGSDYMWRETVRGMTIDKQKRPENLKGAVEMARENLDRILAGAWIDAGVASYGAFTANPATLDYMANYDWMTTALANDNRGNLGYQFGYRALTYYP